MERKLDDFLRKKRKHIRRRRNLTTADVRAEAAKILEEFLQEHLTSHDEGNNTTITESTSEQCGRDIKDNEEEKEIYLRTSVSGGTTDEGKGIEEMTEEEKDQLYSQIASRLASIQDSLMSEKEEQSESDSASAGSKLTDYQKCSPEREFTKRTLTSQENEETREGGDMDAMMACNSFGQVTYRHFQNILQESIGQEQELAEIAAVYQVTKQAMKLAGSSGALAQMCLRYIEDKFANWIVGHGGWEGMLSEDESESDSELD